MSELRLLSNRNSNNQNLTMKHLPLLALFGLVGCQNIPPTVFVREVPVRVTTTNTLDVIRFPSTYTAYTVGRRPDAAHPNVMHEAHILYVREAPDRWNLQPPVASVPSPLPANLVQDGAFAPLSMDAQLRQELQRQQQLSQSLAEQTQRAQQSADSLVPAARQVMELTTQVQKRQQSIDERLRRLEEASGPVSNFTNWPSLGPTNR